MSAGTHGSDPVLIVDDDDGIALLERRILARAGWQSRFAADIGEALAALTEQRFAAVLLDYHLPEGMGWPVLDAARHLVPRVPVIIVTAAGDERVAAEAVRRGAADYLIKTDAFLDQIPTVLERVLRLHEAEETRSRLAAIVDASSDAIISATIDGIISSWNPGAEALYGYTAPEALGRPLSILMPPERAAIAAAIFEQLRRGERIGPTEAVHLRKDGSRVDVSLIISPHRDSAGRVVAASAIARDMAERRAAEAMLHRAKDEAEAAVRTRAEFLANVSHEIRTPMNGVVGMTSLLLDTPLSAEQREYVEAIRSSGNALLTIVNEILDYSKIEAGGLEIDRRPFVLRRCVEEAVDLVATQAAAKGLELCVDIDEGVPDALLGDVTRLRQVLVNLLANAVKFTERGEVVVGIDPARSGAPAGTWRFLVRDTGIGIPRDRLDRLFRPFSQVDAGIARKYGGTGLGLAITRYLVEKMGGALGVLSEEGRGSTFAFTLPAEACEMEGAPESQSPSALMGRRVLIVDDNATCRRLLRSQAMSWGMLPAVFGSAGEALAFLASQPGAPPVDVAVLDSSMPGTDGFALAASIRRRHSASALPIVMLMVFGEAGSRREVERSEHAAFVSKPVKPSALRDALLSALSGNVTAASAGPASAFDGELGKRHPLRILIAEDHSVNQRLAIQMLKRLGYRADVVANGLEVLDALERQPYDVILMDVQMPELDGIGATREIRRRSGAGSAPWIIAMTANAMREDRQRCLEAGMDDYIAKPLSAAALTAAIERAAGVPRRKQPTPRPGAKRTPSAPMPAVSIHRGPFDALVALVGGDQAALAALLDEHLAASSALIASMREALSRGDMGALRDAARSLKGVASKFGALALSHRCAALEEVAGQGGGERTAAAVRAVEVAHTRAAAELTTLVQWSGKPDGA